MNHPKAAPPGDGWWLPTNRGWFPRRAKPAPPLPPHTPLPPQPEQRPAQDAPRDYSAPEPERTTATAAFVCAVVGAVAGLIPPLFFVALPLGIIGIVLGSIGWSTKRLAKASVIVGIIAVGLGVVGIAIVNDGF